MVPISDNLGSKANATSAAGHVIVGNDKISGDEKALIWDVENGTRILEDLLTVEYGLDLSDWELREANDISADGTVIVGWGINPDGFEEGWIAEIDPTPVPIPGAVWLLGSGLIGMVGIRRKFKK